MGTTGLDTTEKKKEAARLARAVTNWSDTPLRRFRELRRAMLKTFGGLLLAKKGEMRQILPLFYSMTSIFLPQLKVKPNPLVTTTLPPLRGFASLTEHAIEFTLAQIEYANTLRMATLEALYGRGITVSGIGERPAGGIKKPTGYLNEKGRIFIRPVSEDDFIEDTAAKNRPDQATFRGHRFMVPYKWALESGRYNVKALERAHARDLTHRRQADKQSIVPVERFIDEIRLATLWLPADNRLVTMAGNMTLADEYLREDGYKGPKTGPYNILTFMELPDSNIPIPPFSVVFDLVTVLNQVANKIYEGALKHKRIIFAAPGTEAQAKAALNAHSDQVITGDPKSAKTAEMGGVAETNYRAAMWMHEQLNQMSGNPNIIGGTGAQAPTLGQEQMVFSAASGIQADRKDRITQFATRDCQNIAWHLWNDEGPLGQTMDMIQKFPAPIGDIPIRWTGETRKGKFENYNFKIKAHSAAADSPDARYAQIVRWIQDVVVPLAQIGASQGTVPDVALLAKLTGRYQEIDEAPEIFGQGTPANSPTVNTPKRSGEKPQRAGTAAPGGGGQKTPSQPPVGKGAPGS